MSNFHHICSFTPHPYKDFLVCKLETWHLCVFVFVCVLVRARALSGLNQWEDIEKLNFFPRLEEVRLQGIPLLQAYTNAERRSLMIAQ